MALSLPGSWNISKYQMDRWEPIGTKVVRYSRPETQMPEREAWKMPFFVANGKRILIYSRRYQWVMITCESDWVDGCDQGFGVSHCQSDVLRLWIISRTNCRLVKSDWLKFLNVNKNFVHIFFQVQNQCFVLRKVPVTLDAFLADM